MYTKSICSRVTIPHDIMTVQFAIHTCIEGVATYLTVAIKLFQFRSRYACHLVSQEEVEFCSVERHAAWIVGKNHIIVGWL